MKKMFFSFLFVLTFLFISPLLISALQTDDPSSIMDQGSTRTCLHVKSAGQISQPNKNKMLAYATLNLDGQCISSTSCEIWLHNSGNSNIETNEAMLKKCKNGGTQNFCNKTDEIEEEIQSDINIDPKWTQITNFTILSSKPGHTSIALGNGEEAVLGVETSATQGSDGTVPPGEVDISVTDKYAAHVDWSYYAVGDGQMLSTEMGAGGAIPIDDQNKTPQIGSFDDPVPTIDINQEGLKEDCVTFYWDPYGRVFDSPSLEPMSGIKVTLLDDVGLPAVIDGPFKNNDITKLDNGVYNILVSKEADYQLAVDAPTTHLFTREVNIHPNYSGIYSNIYLPGDIFHEAPIPVDAPKDFDYLKYQHDIPLVSKGDPYFMPEEDVFVLKSTVMSADMGGFINFKGRVTFPKAKICLVGKESKRIFGNCVNADKYGNFAINIDKNKSPQEYLYIITEKVNLTQPILKSNSIDLSNVNFEDENLTGYEPILNYVEGFAYSEEGQPVPSAKVTVKLKDGDKSFYTTTADATGYFTIYGKNLPFPEYYFEVDDNKGSPPVVLTTSEFVKINKSFLVNQSLNLMNSTKNNQPIINPATGELNQIVRTNNKPLKSAKIVPNLNFLITGVIIILLLVALVAIVVYISKRRVDK